MALGAEQRPDAPTQASPSRPPDWSAVKQWKQHTRRRDSELRLVLCVSGVSVALRFGFWDLGFGIWDFLLSQARNVPTHDVGPRADELLDGRVHLFELRERVRRERVHVHGVTNLLI